MAIIAAADQWITHASTALAISIVPGVLLFMTLGSRLRKRRGARLPGIAAQINASYAARDDSILNPFPKRLPFYSYVSYAAATHVIRCRIDDVECIFFDLHSVGSTGNSPLLYEQTVAMFHFPAGGMPSFELIKWGKDSRFEKAVSAQDWPRMTLRSDPAFSDKFRITTDDEPAMQRLLTAPLCRFIDEHDAWQIESTGAWVAIARRGVVVKAKDYLAFVGEASAYLRALAARG